MIFVDTETLPVQVSDNREAHSLWFGMACYVRIQKQRGKEYYNESWTYFERAGDFWDWVESKQRRGAKLYIFAHNWNFDGAILRTATELRVRGYETLQYINGKPPFILRVKRDKHFLALVDTLNYFTTSLEALGESIGIAKKRMPDYDAPLATWKSYCRRDVEVLRDAILSFRLFVGSNEFGNFRPTLASQAFNAFRHRFYSGVILIHDDEKTLALERDAYFGGRVECFRLGKVRKKLYYLDVNSLYPYVMSENDYPKVFVGVRRAVSTERLGDFLETHAAVARVTLNTDEAAYPIRENGRLIFPVGEFETTLNTPELSYALARGHITKIDVVALYEKGPIFREYVSTLYELRQQYAQADNPAFAYMCKIMLNALYGKFGQRGSVWQEINYEGEPPADEWLEEDYATKQVFKFRVRMGKVQRLSRDSESHESFPAIAGHVTAYGRMLMWELIAKAGAKNVLYMDTDSLIVSAAGYRRLVADVDANRLGALKLEKRADRATFYGPKDYVFGAEVRHKGVRQNAEQIADNIWRQVQFHSWDWHLQETEDGIIYIDTITKQLKREYKKGDVGATGTVTPFRRIMESG